MRLLHHLAICALLLAGCHSPKSVRQVAGAESAVADLNRQIEKFNAERRWDMGITPIAQRVSRLEYRPARGAVNCFDGAGTLFLVLIRQPDGDFKGNLKTQYHELPKPDGHSWGEVFAEFMLPQEMFQKTVQRTGASRFAQKRIERHRRLAPVADLCVGPHEYEACAFHPSSKLRITVHTILRLEPFEPETASGTSAGRPGSFPVR